ncbi:MULTISPECIES: hypothetical protein [unclassified Pseudomonas]|uniref:hypothetical protein n=1 Tax=unclassified Pseudomonas TaxID=196821 RepID=UPI002580ED24|nr:MULTISPECIES: hypothetical protein [unclassified Pseudomonas]
MADLYGLRTRDAAGVITFDTTITPIRSLKMMQVTGNNALDQYIAIPEIQAASFVVVDSLFDGGDTGSYSPQAWYSQGQLQLRRPMSRQWQVMILSQGGEPFSAAGSYGIRSSNNNVRTQIDAINKVLTVRYNGAFNLGLQGPSGSFIEWGEVVFPSPVTTYERPLIFFNAADYMMIGSFHVKGSPGNWTGFRIKGFPSRSAHGDVALYPMAIKWFCASYLTPITPAGGYGASIKDAEGNRLFVTSANLSLLNSQPATNSFSTAGTPITGIGYYASPAQMSWTGSYDDYVLGNALFSSTHVGQTTQQIRANFGGFLSGNRSVLQMYCENFDGINPASVNGRTLFASRPMKPL